MPKGRLTLIGATDTHYTLEFSQRNTLMVFDISRPDTFRLLDLNYNYHHNIPVILHNNLTSFRSTPGYSGYLYISNDYAYRYIELYSGGMSTGRRRLLCDPTDDLNIFTKQKI